MRSEEEMLKLILDTAERDERIRAVMMNGSRANPQAPRDVFQDFDIVYFVTDVEPFKNDRTWIHHFGEIMIMQTPDDMQDPPPGDRGSYAYLMQFCDGNRIDLTFYPVAKLNEWEKDSLSLLLMDKDGLIEPPAPASEKDYLPKPPTGKSFSDCCNEFWWVSTYVAKGLWRKEITYAKYMLDEVMREQLMKMLSWHIGLKTQFLVNPGKQGKYFQKFLEPDLWELLQETYSDAGYTQTWGGLFSMCNLFRKVARPIAAHYGLEYPQGDDERVSAHLEHVRTLPPDVKEMY